MAIIIKPISPPLHPLPPCRARRPPLQPPLSPVVCGYTKSSITSCPTDTFPYLPAELHLQIIETIAARIPSIPNSEQPCDPADLATLCACSLVCKLWLNTARTRMWAGVRLSGRLRSMALVDLLEAYTCGCGPRLNACNDDERNRSAVHEKGCPRGRLSIPSFAPQTMHLSVRETRGNPWDPKWLNDALPYLAAHLTCVRTFVLERVTWEYLSSRSRKTCLESFRHVKELTLCGCSFRSAVDMCEFLAEFDKLEALTLDGVHCSRLDALRWHSDTWVDGQKCVRLPSAALKVVGMRGAPMETILEWIMSGIEHQKETDNDMRITTVKLGGVGIAEAQVVGRFLGEVGGSLRELRVGFDQDFVERGDAFIDHIDLGQNGRLEELHIFGLVVPSPPPPDPLEEEPQEQPASLTQLTLLLSSIRSSIRALSLAMYPADIRAISTVDFEGLAGVFKKSEWAEVEEVRVVISNKGECGLGTVVKQQLSVLNDRRVLRVSVGFDERQVL
ncbi:hypothetical protein F5141DRAFT_1102460 [Pisolithus sp. B1]|nr:hypothetical protein F5141DRAFT_1102460 [Pisolithus sp. B1]